MGTRILIYNGFNSFQLEKVGQQLEYYVALGTGLNLVHNRTQNNTVA